MLNPWVDFTARLTPGFTLRVTPSSTLQVTPSFTPQVTPVCHSASLRKWHLALHLHLTVCTPTLHCLDSCTSQPRSHLASHSGSHQASHSGSPLALHSRWHPASDLRSHLSATQLHSPVTPGFTPAPHCLHTYTSLSKQLHFTVQKAALHCPKSCTPLPRWQSPICSKI